MKVQEPKYYRARIGLIERLIAENNEWKQAANASEKKAIEFDLRLLRKGYLLKSYEEERLIHQEMRRGQYTNDPLSFMELTKYNTYFAIYPKRIAGTYKTTSSLAFPLTVKGTKEDVIQTIESTLNSGTDALELEALALELELELEQELNGMERREGNKQINGLSGLGSLGELVQNEISNNLPVVKNVLERSKNQKEAKSSDKLSFDKVIKSYNKGISRDEITAWVWYKQSLGVPMKGWEDYFITTSKVGDENTLIKSVRETVIRDNHFRELYSVPAGKTLGRPTKKKLTYDKNTYIIFRDAEGLKYVRQSDVKVERTTLKVDAAVLYDLVKNGALYYLSGELLPYSIYAYGNMYDRELELREDKQKIISIYGEQVYHRHLNLIKENRPTALSITNPDPKERPKILAISSFAEEFAVSELKEEYGVVYDEQIPIVSLFAQYLNKLDRSEFEESSAHEIIKYYLNARRVTDRELSKEQKREVKTNARNEGERFFEQFLHEALTIEDQQKLDLTWNRTYNGQSSLPYHKVPIGFEASAKFKQFNLEIRPAQREGIAFMEALGSGVIAYDVGVGKTMTAIVTLANAIQNGKAKRPLIVVPNPTYKKWIREIIGYKDKSGEFVAGVLSNTDITVNDWYNLNKQISTKINFRKKLPEKSITVVTYEGFKKIGFSNKVMDEMFVELSNVLAQSKEGLKERDKEIEYQKYREKIGLGIKGTIADIDALGLDYIVIDEAHRCKNVFETVKADESGNKRFGIQGRTSEIGIKSFFLCNYIQRTYGRNVCLLTATPFTNSPLEIYSILSLVARYGMQQMGLSNIKKFFEQFVQETSEMVVNQREEIVSKDVIKRFNNRLVLQKLIYNHINYKTGEEAGVKRPCKINLPKTTTMQEGRIVKLKPQEQILTYLNMTPLQRMNQNTINAFAKMAAKKKFATADLFRALSQSLNNALSPFLYGGDPEDYAEFVNESPKIKYAVDCIASVKAYHENRNEAVSGQVIYMNRGKHFFSMIKEYLEKEVGFKKSQKWGRVKVDEVEIISSDVSAIRKENVKEAFLAGVVKVIIGTATIREGIDLQTKGTVIYNCYPDWNPTDIRQLEGRIWRQGNEFGYVRVAMPLVQDSMDVFVFQKLEEKTARINDIWYKGDRGNVLDLESLDPEEVKFALITDVEAIANLKLKRLKKDQERKIDRLTSKISTLSEYKGNYDAFHKFRHECLQSIDNERSLLASKPHIISPPTKEDLSALSKEEKEVIQRDQKLYDQLLTFLEVTPQKDRDILKMGRRIEATKRTRWYDSSDFDFFKEYLVKVKKAEKSFQNANGSSTENEIPKLLEQYKNELEEAKQELNKIKSPDYFQELKREVKMRKSAMQVDGKTIEERVNDFAKLNYLLSFKFNQAEYDTCIIPLPEMEVPPEEEDLELLALALELELELLDFVA